MHLKDTANALTLLLRGVQHSGAGGQLAGVDTEEGQTAHIGVSHDLEGERGEGCAVVSGTLFLLVGIGVDAADGGDVHRGGHILHNGIQQLLNALVAVRGTANHGYQQVVDGALTQSGTDHVGGDLFLLQDEHHDLLINIGHAVQQLGAIFLSQLQHILGDGLNTHVLAHVVIINVGIHLHQINDAAEIALGADGQLDGHSVGLQALVDHVQNTVEVSAHDVHLIDIDHPGDLVVVSLTPNGLRLRLNAALGAHDGHRAVQHAQGALHLDGEVHVARGVNDVDAVGLKLVVGAAPEAGGSSGGNGDTALLLLDHPVHSGVTLMGLADLMVDAGVEQNTLGGSGLTSVDMSHDADISGLFQRNFSRH